MIEVHVTENPSTALDSFAPLLEALRQGYLVLSDHWAVLFANSAAGSIWGFDAVSAAGRALSEVCPEFYESDGYGCCKSVMATRQRAQFEIHVPGEGDAGCAYEVHVDPVPAGLSLLAIDITERCRAKRTVQKLNADLSATLQALPDMLFEVNASGTYLNVWARNPALLAREREVLLGHTIPEMLPAEAANVAMAAILEAAQRGTSFGKVICLDVPEGIRWFELSIARKDGTNGSAPNFMVLSRDVTERKLATRRLNKLQRAFESAQWGIAVITGSDGFEVVNPAYARMHGYSPDELAGKPTSIVYPAYLQASHARLAASNRSDGSCGYYSEHMHRDGYVFPVRADATTVTDTFGNVAFRIVNVQDVSELRNTHNAMRLSEELFRSFFDHSPIGIAVADLDGRYTQVNKAMCELTGYAERELLDLTWRDVTHPEDVGDNEVKRSRLLSGTSGSFRMAKRYVRKDGSTVWVLMVVSIIRDPDGATRYTLGQMLDITGLKQREAELLRSREQLRSLAAHQEGLLDAERKHIAGEIHDRLGQQLTALRMEVGLLRMQHEDSAAVREFCRRMSGLIDETIPVVRDIASALHPIEMVLGLRPAILALADTFQKRYGMRCEVSCPEQECSPPPPIAAMIYRVIQESLTNVARHARATQVRISGRLVDESFVIEIVDDGVGFDVETALNGRTYGLFGTKERVNGVGGELLVESRPGQGTKITIRLPWEG